MVDLVTGSDYCITMPVVSERVTKCNPLETGDCCDNVHTAIHSWSTFTISIEETSNQDLKKMIWISEILLGTTCIVMSTIKTSDVYKYSITLSIILPIVKWLRFHGKTLVYSTEIGNYTCIQNTHKRHPVT